MYNFIQMLFSALLLYFDMSNNTDKLCIQQTHQKMRYPNVTPLYFATALAFNAPYGGISLNDLRKIWHGGQRMAKVQNGGEILPKVSTP